MKPSRLALALLPTLLLAGCSGGGGGGGPAPADGGLPGGLAGESAGAQASVLRFDLATPVHKVVWANGTVNAQDTCNTGACIGSTDRVVRVTDLTPELPAGVPTYLEVDLRYQPNPLNFGGFDAWVESSTSTFYQYSVDWEPGRVQARIMVRPVGEVRLVFFAGGPGGEAPATPYTLSVRVDADPELVPPSVPVAVPLGPGATLSAETSTGAPADFLLYGPDDALLGRFPGSHALPAGAPRGDYVALLPSGGAVARLSTDAGPAALRALGVALALGPEGTLPPTGAYDATWDVTGWPLGVGVAGYTVEDAAGQKPLASAGWTMSLSGPGGYRLDSGEMCGLCLTFGDWWSGVGSGVGDERVVAGTYAVHAESQATYGLRVAPYALYLDRAA